MARGALLKPMGLGQGRHDGVCTHGSPTTQKDRIQVSRKLGFTSNQVDVTHQLLLVGSTDGNFQIAHLHGVLKRVDVLNLVQVHHEVAAHSDETI